MEKNLTALTTNNAAEVLEDIQNAFFDIPFGNSKFQIESFVIAASITPARAYRAIGMQMQVMLTNFEGLQYDKKMQDIKIEELQAQVNDENINIFERKRKQLELENLIKENKWSKKLLNDALVELNLYYEYFKSMPRYTRDQFEAEEETYYEQSLRRQCLGLIGAKESIMNMIDDRQTIKNFVTAIAALPENKIPSLINEIAKESLAGKIEFKEKPIEELRLHGDEA